MCLSKFNCEVKIVDERMGVGKTTAAINYINQSSEDEKFLFITPYLSEVERIKRECPEKRFKQPCLYKGRKLEGIKELINKGHNIVSTHALFQKFDLEVIDLCRAKNYTLIMDEVTDVVEKYEISDTDFKILTEKFVDIDKETGRMTWRDKEKPYYGKFIEEKRLCELNSLAYYNGTVVMWLFPIEVFNAFRQIYILTYMFNKGYKYQVFTLDDDFEEETDDFEDIETDTEIAGENNNDNDFEVPVSVKFEATFNGRPYDKLSDDEKQIFDLMLDWNLWW